MRSESTSALGQPRLTKPTLGFLVGAWGTDMGYRWVRSGTGMRRRARPRGQDAIGAGGPRIIAPGARLFRAAGRLPTERNRHGPPRRHRNHARPHWRLALRSHRAIAGRGDRHP